MDEATTKQNTMNVPMCKLQAERRSMVSFPFISVQRGRALNYLDKCIWTGRRRLRVSDSRFGVIAKYFEIGGKSTDAASTLLCHEGFVYCWRALVH